MINIGGGIYNHCIKNNYVLWFRKGSHRNCRRRKDSYDLDVYCIILQCNVNFCVIIHRFFCSCICWNQFYDPKLDKQDLNALAFGREGTLFKAWNMLIQRKFLTVKGPSIKDVRSQGGGGLSSADKGDSSDVDVRTFWCKNYRVFRNFWCVRTDKGEEGVQGWASLYMLQTRGRRSIFGDFVRTFFTDGP